MNRRSFLTAFAGALVAPGALIMPSSEVVAPDGVQGVRVTVRWVDGRLEMQLENDTGDEGVVGVSVAGAGDPQFFCWSSNGRDYGSRGWEPIR